MVYRREQINIICRQIIDLQNTYTAVILSRPQTLLTTPHRKIGQGKKELKPEQETVVQVFLSGKGVFAALPTGYGKSLCYACFPYAFDNKGSIVICVPPLTSLIVNQKAKFVGEAQCDPQVVESICEGKAQLLFISPELLLSNPSWRDMLRTAVYQDNLSGFVVDEAHSC